jgi:hypothetical protein
MGAKLLPALGAAVLALIGVAALAAFFVSRDDATVPQDEEEPGVERVSNSAPRVEPGNVVLLYSDERLTSDLRALARRTAGEPSAALAAAGQAVLLERRPNLRVPVTAVTAERRLEAASPGDAKLRSFIEYWLGKRS